MLARLSIKLITIVLSLSLRTCGLRGPSAPFSLLFFMLVVSRSVFVNLCDLIKNQQFCSYLQLNQTLSMKAFFLYNLYFDLYIRFTIFTFFAFLHILIYLSNNFLLFARNIIFNIE